MWLFISTEILFSAVVFVVFHVPLKNPVDFHAGSQELSRFFGTLNTAFLITSSFTVVLGGALVAA